MNITDKGLMIGLGVLTVVGIGAYFGIKSAKKKKAEKAAKEDIDFDALMRKQYEEEMKYRKEKEHKEWIKTTDDMIKKAEAIMSETPVTREDLVDAVTSDPEFGKLLAKYISPVKLMSMKHMPSKYDMDKKPVESSDDGHTNINAQTVHKVDHQRGIEYDVTYPIDSHDAITNVKPITNTQAGYTVGVPQSIHDEIFKTLSQLSEYDQIAIARRVVMGEAIIICGKKIGLVDIPVFNQDKSKMSPNIASAIDELIQSIAFNFNKMETPVEEPIQDKPATTPVPVPYPFLEGYVPPEEQAIQQPATPTFDQEVMLDMLAKQNEDSRVKAQQVNSMKTAADYNNWIKSYRGGM